MIDSPRLAVSLRKVAAAALVSAAFALFPAALCAQQGPTAMPDTTGAAAAPLDNTAAAQSQVPDPMNAADDTGESATASVPGGGQVQAQGPAPATTGSSIPPNETWGASRIDPNGNGTTPMGP